jgi:small subunit ribosomal protein S6
MADRRRYELMLILDPRLEESVIQGTVDRFFGVVKERGGEVAKVDTWGRKRFSFPIKHLEEGYYVLADLDTDPDTVAELDRQMRLADELVRHKFVRPGKD